MINTLFRAGGELNQLDLEKTLDVVISQGKQLDQITEEDLFVPDRSKGQADLCVFDGWATTSLAE